MRRSRLLASVVLTLLMNLVVFTEKDFSSYESGRLNRATSSGNPIVISGIVNPRDTMSHIFRRYGIRLNQMIGIRQAALHVYRLRDIMGGHSYTITLDSDNSVRTLQYRIDKERILRIARAGEEFSAVIRTVDSN